MKQMIYLTIILLGAITTKTSLLHAEEITLVIGDYAPYIDDKAENKGLLSDIVVQAFAKEGITASIDFKPWKRVEENAIQKEGRLSYGWIHTTERAAKWLYSNPIYSSADVFITRADSDFSWKTLEDLKPYRIGVIRGYSQGDAFEAFKSQLQVQVADSDLANLRKLLAKRIDIFPSDPVVAAHAIRTSFTTDERSKFRVVPEPNLGVSAMHMVCAKSYAKCQYYLDKFNTGQKKLEADGRKQQIIDKATQL